MTTKSALGCLAAAALLAVLVGPAQAQPAPPARGQAELKAGAGAITVDYGRPSLRGRDMLAQLQEGAFWRMGMNQATVLKTPVDLRFGSVAIAKGAYSLWLKKVGAGFELAFNSQTGQWGTQHDPAKDVATVAMTKGSLASPVEMFTMELTPNPKGGTLSLSWGETKLGAGFEIVK